MCFFVKNECVYLFCEKKTFTFIFSKFSVKLFCIDEVLKKKKHRIFCGLCLFEAFINKLFTNLILLLRFITFIYFSIAINASFAVCNRTYYGNLGMTNHLELPRLRDERLPFICELNFTAAGGTHGDIIQVCMMKNGMISV